MFEAGVTVCRWFDFCRVLGFILVTELVPGSAVEQGQEQSEEVQRCSQEPCYGFFGDSVIEYVNKSAWSRPCAPLPWASGSILDGNDRASR